MASENKSDISVVILTKNEAAVIAGCIDSVLSLNPNEILVIDDESSDATRPIAQKIGVTVILHKKKDFAEVRNFASREVKSSWILYLDADEKLSENLIKEIRKTLKESKFSAYRMIRENYYLGKKWPYHEKIIRLINKQMLVRWFGEVHESPEIRGEIGEMTEPFYHFTHRNLSEMVQATLAWSKIEAQLRFNAHHPPVSWWRFPRVMMPVFWDYYIKQGGWKVGSIGLIESIYQAFSIFITYARLWELQQKKI